MSKAFEKIMNGLGEARAQARGETVAGLRVNERRIASDEVSAVRLKAGLTQAEFADLLGASLGTVRKWESGERSPSGAAARLLRILDAKPKIIADVLGFRPAAPGRKPRNRLVAAV